LFPEGTFEMVIEGNVLQSHLREAGVTEGSPVSLILFAIFTAGLIKWVQERVQAECLSFFELLRQGATGMNLNQLVE
jgi:hypothetical protein